MTGKLVLDSSIDKDQVRVLLFGANLTVVAEMTFEFPCIANASVETNTSHDVELKVSFYDDRLDVRVYLGDPEHGIVSGMALVTTAVARETARLEADAAILSEREQAHRDGKREGVNEGHEKGWAAASHHYDDLIPTLRSTARSAGFSSGYKLGYTTSELEWLVLLTSFPL